jgi:hypothetical protein
MYKLDKLLYHGTSNAASIFIVGGNGLNAPVHLCEDKCRAEHYAKAATAYLEDMSRKESNKPIATGYAVFTFHSLPSRDYLIEDDYNPKAEPGQYKYTKPIKGLQHFTVERYPLEITDAERLRLYCFAIGMWKR